MASRLALVGLAGLMLLVIANGCKEPAENPPTTPDPSPAPPPLPLPQSRFLFPTENRALLQSGSETNFFTPTGPGRPWTSGAFGCVRNSGTRIHEGIDIQALHWDEAGEATDVVRASLAGTVAYINTNTAASNYGKYVVLQHEIEELPIYTLYAHLSTVDAGLDVGQPVKAGAALGILGRTSNTREGISKARAHLHFEIGLQIHTEFNSWFGHWFRGGKNHHGAWNGMNLLGLDAAEILRAQADGEFKLLSHVRRQPMLCRVRIHQGHLEWAERFPALVENPPPAETRPVRGWEVDLNFNAIPIRLKPLHEEGLKQKAGNVRFELLAVDDAIQKKHPCRSLVFKKGARWVLTTKGQRALDLLAWGGN